MEMNRRSGLRLSRYGVLCVLALTACGFAQQGSDAQQKADSQRQAAPQTPGTVSTGGVHAAVLDSEKRPITAGGFVDSGPIVFQDISEKAGLTKWRHVMGTPQKN